MANLSETPDYPAGVYQLETSDPVLGGPGGIANRQAEQLANRTSWLKAKVDAFIDGTVAVFKATKLATARTLSISGAGSGSASFDGSANANISLTLADSGAVAGTYPKVTVNAKGIVIGGAALGAADIPANLALTGDPTAPTPPQFDADSSLTTAEFVQRALGNFQNQISKSASSVLLASEAGAVINLIAGAVNTTLPLLSSVPKGASFTFICTGQNGASILRNGTDPMSANGVTQVSYAMNIGDTLTLVSAGTLWLAVSGTARDKFQVGLASTLSATGVKRIPDASSPTGFFIIQWGVATSNGSGVGSVVLPIAFPNLHFRTFLTPRNSAPYNASASVNLQTVSGFAFYTTNASGGSVGAATAMGIEWLAIGY